MILLEDFYNKHGLHINESLASSNGGVNFLIQNLVSILRQWFIQSDEDARS